MNSKHVFRLICISLVLVFLGSCSNQNFPYGTYVSETGYILTFAENGTCTLKTDDASVLVSATFSIQGNEVTWEKDDFCKSVGAENATYTWTYENDALVLNVKGDDLCTERKNIIENVEFLLKK